MRLLRLSLLTLAFIVPPLSALAAEPNLTIASPGRTLILTASEIAALPRTELKVVDMSDQKERHYAGVAVRELLTRIGAPLGEKMRGSALTLGVMVRCKDGYAVLFSLAEFDANFSDRTILLADQEDGQMLPPSAAPFRLVVPGDKRGARGARGVSSLEIVSFAQP